MEIGKNEKRVKIGKANEKKKEVAGKHSCIVNGPEWGDSEIGDVDDSMEISQGNGRIREKRVSNFEETRAKKTRPNRSLERGVEENDQDLKFKMILRFGDEKGISSMSPVKLTSILRNQIGDIGVERWKSTDCL